MRTCSFCLAASQRGLASTLFLSTYPLSFEGDDALALDHQFKRYSLPSGNLQGLFNVAQLLLWRLNGAKEGPQSASLRAYGEMKAAGDADHAQYPGFWLLTLTRLGSLPADWMKAGAPANWLDRNPHPDPQKQLPGEMREPLSSAGWRITSEVSSIAIVLCCVLFLRLEKTNRISWQVWHAPGVEECGPLSIVLLCVAFRELHCVAAGRPGFFGVGYRGRSDGHESTARGGVRDAARWAGLDWTEAATTELRDSGGAERSTGAAFGAGLRIAGGGLAVFVLGSRTGASLVSMASAPSLFKREPRAAVPRAVRCICSWVDGGVLPGRTRARPART